MKIGIGNFRTIKEGNFTYESLNRYPSEITDAESIVQSLEEIANGLKGLGKFNKKVNGSQLKPKLLAITRGLSIGSMGVLAYSLLKDHITGKILDLPLPQFIENIPPIVKIFVIASSFFTLGKISAIRQMRKSIEAQTRLASQKPIELYRAYAELSRLKEDLKNAVQIPALDRKQKRRVYRSLLQIFNNALSIDVSTKRKEWLMRGDTEEAISYLEILQVAAENLKKRGYGKLAIFCKSPYHSPEIAGEIQKPISLLQQWYYRFILNRSKARFYADALAAIGEGEKLVLKKENLLSRTNRLLSTAGQFTTGRKKTDGNVNLRIYEDMLIAFKRDGNHYLRGGVIARELIFLLDKIIDQVNRYKQQESARTGRLRKTFLSRIRNLAQKNSPFPYVKDHQRQIS